MGGEMGPVEQRSHPGTTPRCVEQVDPQIHSKAVVVPRDLPRNSSEPVQNYLLSCLGPGPRAACVGSCGAPLSGALHPRTQGQVRVGLLEGRLHCRPPSLNPAVTTPRAAPCPFLQLLGLKIPKHTQVQDGAAPTASPRFFLLQPLGKCRLSASPI